MLPSGRWCVTLHAVDEDAEHVCLTVTNRTKSMGQGGARSERHGVRRRRRGVHIGSDGKGDLMIACGGGSADGTAASERAAEVARDLIPLCKKCIAAEHLLLRAGAEGSEGLAQGKRRPARMLRKKNIYAGGGLGTSRPKIPADN